MKRVELNSLNAAFFLIVSASAFVGILISNMPAWKYIVYPLPFLLTSIAIFLFKKKLTPKITAGLFLAFSIMSIVFGDHGNLTGSIFLCFALYVFASTRISIVSGVVTILVILAKAIIDEWTIPQMVNYLSAYAYILAVYWVLIHPKVKIHAEALDYETMEILRLVVMGIHKKEIADRMDMTQSGISKRLERARVKMNARSDIELGIMLSKRGHIVL